VRSSAERERVAQLAASGLNNCQIERETGIPRRTVSDWRGDRSARRTSSTCPVCDGTPQRLPAASNAYLLGAYLGDGHIALTRRGVYRLRVACDLMHLNIAWWIALAIEHPRRTYEYVRYQFTNRSDDIRQIFCDACDPLGVGWRVMNRDTISVARRESVSKLDAFVGPKR
jgi:hypothetical protein